MKTKIEKEKQKKQTHSPQVVYPSTLKQSIVHSANKTNKIIVKG